jgi:5-methylcytosine-specific restriction endonuclease McrA
MIGHCALCGREERLTRHHLIPRTRHHNRRNKREFDRVAVKETVGLCRPCHSQVHALLSEKELEREWNTIEKIRAHPEVEKFVAWIAGKPRGFRIRVRDAR